MSTRKVRTPVITIVAAAAFAVGSAAPSAAAAPTYSGIMVCTANGGGSVDLSFYQDPKKVVNAEVRAKTGSDPLQCPSMKNWDDSGLNRDP